MKRVLSLVIIFVGVTLIAGAVSAQQAPVLDPIGSQSVDEGANLNFGVSASDPDLDSLILSAVNLPSNATLTDT